MSQTRFQLNTLSSKQIFFFLTVVCSVLLSIPTCDFQPIISTGDHGRDLYAFSRVLEGDQIYKDFWWTYGPLMPYYYSVILKFLGVNLQSVLVGKYLLLILSGIFFYLILSTLIRPSMSFIGALWFLVFNHDFFINFNHYGGILSLLIITYCLFLYNNQQSTPILYVGSSFILGLIFIKANFGFIALFIFLVSVVFIDKINALPLKKDKLVFFVFSIFIIPPLAVLVYALHFADLPLTYIRQCLPFLIGDHPHFMAPSKSAGLFLSAVYRNMTTGWHNIAMAFIVILTAVQTLRLTLTKQLDKSFTKRLIPALCILTLFYVINFHEYLFSGVLYRTLWSKHFSYLLMFTIIAIGTQHLSKGIRLLLSFTLLFIIFSAVLQSVSLIKQRKTPEHYLALKRGKVYLGNSPLWNYTVQQTTHFLNYNLKPDETFFALPYDPLYYYLTDRKSPTRLLIFFDHILIKEEQQKKIIRDLEKNNVNWVLISSRENAQEPGLGQFGSSYCVLIADYIKENFEPVAKFGDWVNPPGWTSGHGTRILKRIVN